MENEINTGENAVTDLSQAADRADSGGKDISDTSEKPSRMTWEQIMQDPAYSAEMEKVIRARLADAAKKDGSAAGRAVMRRHLAGIIRQAQSLQAAFPNVDTDAVLADRRFLLMTSPMVGLSPEDAYFALNRRTLQADAMRYAARKSAERLSDAIRSGSMRPIEHGVSAIAGASAARDGMTKAQRTALKAQIRQAAALGKKIFPR